MSRRDTGPGARAGAQPTPDGAAPTRQEWTVPARLAGQRLDAVLAELLPQRSRAAWQKAVRRGRVRLDGERVLRSNLRPAKGARLAVSDLAPAPAPPDFALIHEDEDILVVDKPGGLLTHGNEKGGAPSLAELLAERFGRLPMLMGEERPGIVHRLDRQTSGVLVVARTASAMEELRRAFRERTVRKDYLALVHGRPAGEELELDWELGPCAGHPDRQECRASGQGKVARTRVELAEALGDFSLLRCRPSTGRRHQIRVHLSAAGLPIVADEMYRLRAATPLPAGAPALAHHALHAERLGFRHPRTGESVEFRAELPGPLRRLVDWLRERAAR